MASSRKLVSELKKDFTHGSSWYFEKISNLLSETDGTDVEFLKDSLPHIRPGMGSISNIWDLLNSQKFESREQMNELGRELLRFGALANSRLRKQAVNIKLSSALTLSYSQAVRTLIEMGNLSGLVILESLPGRETKTAAEIYGKYCKVAVVPDSALCSCIKDVESVVMGFDGLFAGGDITNKIGSYAVCLCAKEMGKRVIAVGESFKASSNPIESVYEKEVRVEAKTIILPLFDIVPVELIDTLVTDLGIVRNPGKHVANAINQQLRNALFDKESSRGHQNIV